jgi:isopenicillin N synthase-like dioxygenase
MISLGRHLFAGFALALDLPENWFEPKIEKPMGQLRVLYYPPQDGKVDPNHIGIGAHTDYECFTILAQSERGLQVQNRKGEWIAAPPVPGAFVVNIGDCMQRWTNDRFRSTIHRVINLSGRKRYSLAFFYGANYHAMIECLPTCQDAANPPRHPPVMAGDWTVANIRAAYTYAPKAI